MASRKRTSSQRTKTLELDRREEGDETHPKLLLRSRQRESGLSVLENCLSLPEDDMIESLLQASQLLLCRLPEDWEESFEVIKRIWQKYCTNPVVCAVIVNTLVQFVSEIPPLSSQHLNYILSMFENGQTIIKQRV